MTSSNQLKQVVSLKQESSNCNPCMEIYHRERKATLTIDSPRVKDIPVCEECFKKINCIMGILQNHLEGLTSSEIYQETKMEGFNSS